ncbi:EI24 domain-containing protein [Sulfurimonas sp. SWIR-19]|uniref:EI24 domain-containing protein n=1 Tax=Sulfurimonas sp. SWIR-19 TaxID=2878390 RepID=UPI001CF48019|nr:EI24 domain-containing protein [Sulfurimonas sp. SWIR-19]UCM99419.1 EI24 domain-containing protein [Sulfurimonas sp. SWIR-19]
MNNEIGILSLSLKDLFTKKMLIYSLMPFIVSMLILYILFFIVAGLGVDQLTTMEVQTTQTTIENGIPHTESFQATLAGTGIMKFLMSSALTSWIATFLIYTIGGLMTLYASIFVALLIIGFLTHAILKELQQRHYQDVQMIGYSNAIEGIFLTLKWILIMILLFFVFIPLYFIPVINIVAFNFPLYYFFHKMLTYDVSSAICTKEEAMKIKFFHANTLRLKTLGLYLLSLIPFVIFFASVFYVIYLGHSYFIETRKLRNES